MSESKHTPGPWSVKVGNTVVAKRLTGNASNNGILYVIDADGNDVACLPRFSNEANARLIATAPVNAELAGAGLELARAIRGSTHITPRIMVLARCIIEAAEPKER